jgi:hypothetical protein
MLTMPAAADLGIGTCTRPYGIRSSLEILAFPDDHFLVHRGSW